MDPITTIVFASSLILGGGNARLSNFNSSSTKRAATEYILDRRTAISDETVIANISEPVFSELLSYGTLADGWDGDGSLAPAAADIEEATMFVQLLRPHLPLPTAMLNPDGQVGLYWSTADAYIDINFEKDGKISVYTRDLRMQPNAETYRDNLNPRELETLFPLIEILNPVELAA